MVSDYKVSVIVCTLGRPSLLKCLESIFEQSYENLEIIVVSPNKNVEKIVSIVESSQFSNIKFLLSDRDNSSKQRNIGIGSASGELVAFIDDDAIADKVWLSYLIRHYNDEEVMCVGGKIIPKFLGEVPDELKKLPDSIFKGFLGGTLLEFEDPVVIDRPALWASNISFRGAIFKVIGGFDEELGKTRNKLLCEEEIDIQTKILEKGFKIIYEPKSLVTHLIDSDKLTKEYFIKRSFWQGYSEVIKIKKYERFQNAFGGLNQSQLKYINNLKLLELLFEMTNAPDFEKSLNKSYELGRIVALSSLIKR